MSFLIGLKKYTINILVSIDQFGNTLLGGSPDETISSRVGRNYQGSIFQKTINKIFFWQKDHCSEAIEEGDFSDAIFKSREK